MMLASSWPAWSRSDPARAARPGTVARHLGADLVTVPGLAARAGSLRDQAGHELASIIRAKEAS